MAQILACTKGLLPNCRNFSKPKYKKFIKMFRSTHAAAAAAKSLQSCPTLCDPIVGSPWGSPIPGILQARTLEWVAISFSNAWKWKAKVKSLSHREPGKSSNSACRGSLKDQKWLPYHLNPFPKKVPKKFPTKKELAVLGSFVSEYLVHQKQHFRVFVCAWIK